MATTEDSPPNDETTVKKEFASFVAVSDGNETKFDIFKAGFISGRNASTMEQPEDDGCSFGRRVDPDTLANICDTHGKVCAEQSKDSAPMDGEREIYARVEAAKRYRRINGDSRWHAAIEDGFVAGAMWALQQQSKDSPWKCGRKTMRGYCINSDPNHGGRCFNPDGTDADWCEGNCAKDGIYYQGHCVHCHGTVQAFDDEDHLGSALMAWFLDYENEIRSNEQRETALGELSLRLKESNV